MMSTQNRLLARRQRGVTLIELMVSITVGLLLVLFVSTLYLSSRSSARINDASSRMQEEGRSVMYLIGRNLMQAGFGTLTSSDMATFVSKAKLTDFTGDGLLGCQKGFDTPSSLASKACKETGTAKPAFQVSYRVDNTYSSTLGIGTDCNGQEAKYKDDGSEFGATDKRYATNRFYLNTTNKTLNCVGNGGTEQPLLANVEDMQISYGLATSTTMYDADGFRSIERYVDADGVGTAWGDVLSVEVCLELSSNPNENVTPNAQTYLNCSGTSVDAPDRRLHTVMRSVFALRNNASVRNFTMK